MPMAVQLYTWPSFGRKAASALLPWLFYLCLTSAPCTRRHRHRVFSEEWRGPHQTLLRMREADINMLRMLMHNIREADIFLERDHVK